MLSRTSDACQSRKIIRMCVSDMQQREPPAFPITRDATCAIAWRVVTGPDFETAKSFIVQLLSTLSFVVTSLLVLRRRTPASVALLTRTYEPSQCVPRSKRIIRLENRYFLCSKPDLTIVRPTLQGSRDNVHTSRVRAALNSLTYLMACARLS